jgi:protein required for attachment to host cells
VKTRAWIVLADSASARLYETDGLYGTWRLLAELAHAGNRPRQPGTGRLKHVDGARPATELPTSHNKAEVEKFARELARALEDGLAKRAYEQLILVVPSAFLGFLRGQLSHRVLARIATVVERDYLHIDERQARERLEEQLHAH